MKNYLFAPGCAYMLYKPEQAKKLFAILSAHVPGLDWHMTCCLHDPALNQPVTLINVCPGCHKRYAKDYINCATVSVWEMLAESTLFSFPDYQGKKMTLLDACPVREYPGVHQAIRTLLNRMNIELVENEKQGSHSVCCGDSFYGKIPVRDVENQMKIRADEMELDDVIVYCVSCTKSLFIGGKKPHFLIDLLLMEEHFPRPLIWMHGIANWIHL